MKIVLQHIKSELYYEGPGAWTKRLEEAFDFGHSLRAMEFVRQYRLTGVAVVVAFIETRGIETHAFPVETVAQMQAHATAG